MRDKGLIKTIRTLDKEIKVRTIMETIIINLDVKTSIGIEMMIRNRKRITEINMASNV